MATIKIVLRQKSNQEGDYPLALRITKERKSLFIYTEYYIKKTEWDKTKKEVKKNHSNSVRLNNLLLSRLAKANGVLIDLESTNEPYSLHTLKEKIAGKLAGKSSHVSFFDFADEYFQTMLSSGSYQRQSAEQPAISHFKRFLGQLFLQRPELV